MLKSKFPMSNSGSWNCSPSLKLLLKVLGDGVELMEHLKFGYFPGIPVRFGWSEPGKHPVLWGLNRYQECFEVGKKEYYWFHTFLHTSNILAIKKNEIFQMTILMHNLFSASKRFELMKEHSRVLALRIKLTFLNGSFLHLARNIFPRKHKKWWIKRIRV